MPQQLICASVNETRILSSASSAEAVCEMPCNMIQKIGIFKAPRDRESLDFDFFVL